MAEDFIASFEFSLTDFTIGYHLDAEFEGNFSIEISPAITYVVDIEFAFSVGLNQHYIGPGTGFVVNSAVPFLNRLREGDSFPVSFRWASPEGIDAIAHVMNRIADTDRSGQRLTVQPVFPEDPANKVILSRGEQPVVKPPEQNSLTRTVIRNMHEQKLEARKQARRQRN